MIEERKKDIEEEINEEEIKWTQMMEKINRAVDIFALIVIVMSLLIFCILG